MLKTTDSSTLTPRSFVYLFTWQSSSYSLLWSCLFYIKYVSNSAKREVHSKFGYENVSHINCLFPPLLQIFNGVKSWLEPRWQISLEMSYTFVILNSSLQSIYSILSTVVISDRYLYQPFNPRFPWPQGRNLYFLLVFL